MFINWEGQSQKTVSTDHNLFEEKGELKLNRAEALLLTSLTPYRQAKPAHFAAIRRAYQTVFVQKVAAICTSLCREGDVTALHKR